MSAVGSQPSSPPGSSKRRKLWERKYAQKHDTDFAWYLEEPPDELIELVENTKLPKGGALDLGCGPGVATNFLAGNFSPTVGLDIAFGALVEARSRTRATGKDASFLVAEAPLLPFQVESFSLIFDRGCLQAIPKDAWPAYFREVDRLLKPGGVLQLFCSKPLPEFPRLLSYRGIRARARWLLGRRGPQFLSHSLLRQLAGSLEVQSLEDSLFRPRAGLVRAMTRGTFRKR